MNLPHHEQAFVPPEKLSDYLLSLSHPIGRSKAVFFRALGYDENNTERLVEALLNIARTGDVRDTIETKYGVKYVVLGELTGPGADGVDCGQRANGPAIRDRLSTGRGGVTV
jgi:hypothetical protein